MARLIGIIFFLGLAAYGGLWFYYGSPHPCGMLAEEQGALVAEVRGALLGEPTPRECVDELWREWFGS